MTGLSIGEIARQAGIEPSTIRYYEQIGILPRAKRINGRRVYEEDDVLKRITLIQAAKSVNFTMAEILELISLWQAQGRPPVDWRLFVERKRAEIDTLIAQAEQMRRALDAFIACGCWDDSISLETFVASAHLNSHSGPNNLLSE